MAIYVRAFSAEEKAEVEKLVHSWKEAKARVQRAKVLWLSSQGEMAPAISREVGLHVNSVRERIHRFNGEGLEAALSDRPRSGCPATYDERMRGEIISVARTAPKALGVQMCHWTLEQLQYYVNEQKGISIGYRQIQRILKAEHINWRKSRTWLKSEDPDFAEKRGILLRVM